MDHVLGFHVFDGAKWLSDDEKTWTEVFHNSASFNDAKLAQDVGERQAKGRTIYILACLGWQS